MTIDLSRFREAAQAGGFIRLDEDHSRLVNYGKSIWGRFVTWVKIKLHIGSFADQNRQVMKSFYKALKSQYGKGFAQEHAKSLKESSKPLSARTVSELIEKGDQAWKDLSAGKIFKALLEDALKQNQINLPTKLEHKVLSRKIANSIHHASSRVEAFKVAEGEIRKRCDQLKALMDHIDGMDIQIQEKEILKRLVTKSEDLKYPEQINLIWAARKEAMDLVDYLKSNDELETTPFLQKLKRLYDSADTQLKTLMEFAQKEGKDLGADDLMAFYHQVLTLGLDLCGLSADDAGAIYRNLTTERMAGIRDALNFVLSGGVGDTLASVPVLASRMSNFQNLLLLEAGRRIGKPEHEIKKDVLGPNRVKSLKDIPDDLFRPFNDIGIVLRPGMSWLSDIRSRVDKDAFAIGKDATKWFDSQRIDRQAVKDYVLEDLKKDLSNIKNDTGILELNEKFIQDFFRTSGGYLVNGELHVGALNLSDDEREAKLESFVAALGGKDVARLVARVAHQGVFASLQNALRQEDKEGGFEKILTFMGEGTVMTRYLIDVKDSAIRIRCENSRQLVSATTQGPDELGVNYSIALTIEGANTENPTIRLDDWDVLFSSLRYE